MGVRHTAVRCEIATPLNDAPPMYRSGMRLKTLATAAFAASLLEREELFSKLFNAHHWCGAVDGAMATRAQNG